ncbi:hypothetical protein JCM21714_3584 [Gracilibacillus boraciitolerans JCM 21714]|uniref:Methyl-accepting chemotaxis protein n=1 Tax=Gracilibacillus boraciitolerans JCM 21714 TaxID=1298598 RepID=W4VNN9_9BACI|nr:HAMP domain-containing protein [Gracilibacillus boraciitolerans]GAE94428.1 hypothetical protein JCM21714_3584 [Gracilibacillus boraciitolerans JCM 21714]
MKKLLKDRKLSTKLYSILGLAIIVIIVSSALLMNTILTVSDDLKQQLYDDLYQPSSNLLNADRDLYQSDQALITSFLDEGNKEEYMSVYEENVQQVEEQMKNVEAILKNNTNLDQSVTEKHFASFNASFDRWKNISESIFQSTDRVMINSLLDNMREEFDLARNEIDLLQQELEATTTVTLEEIEQTTNIIFIFFIIVILIFIGLLFLLSFLLIKQITKPISQLVDVNEQIANGNLNIERLMMIEKMRSEAWLKVPIV